MAKEILFDFFTDQRRDWSLASRCCFFNIKKAKLTEEEKNKEKLEIEESVRELRERVIGSYKESHSINKQRLEQDEEKYKKNRIESKIRFTKK